MRNYLQPYEQKDTITTATNVVTVVTVLIANFEQVFSHGENK